MNKSFYTEVKKRLIKKPILPDDGFIAKNATIIGDVTIAKESNIWFNVVIRGDVNNVVIGQRTNIQDGTVIHVSSTLEGTYIGDDVTIGHQALLHACTIKSGAFIGMQACIMDGATIEEGAMVAAGSLVTPNKCVKSGQLWGGRPARYMRDLTDGEKEMIKHSAKHYVELSNLYINQNE